MKYTFTILMLIVIVIFSSCSNQKSKTDTQSEIIISEWQKIVHYTQNDLSGFCIFSDNEKIWHILGTIGEGHYCSYSSYFHSSGPDLLTLFSNHDTLMTGEVGEDGIRIHRFSPFVIEHDNSYFLFYRTMDGTIARRKTEDVMNWNVADKDVFKEKHVKDVYLTKIDSQFYMYYCRIKKIDGINRGAVILRKSHDLEKWSDPVLVYADLEFEDSYPKIGSLCITKVNDGYYLFLKNRHISANFVIAVFYSKDPEKFQSGVRTWIHEIKNSEYTEIVKNNDKFYILRTSGPQHLDKDENRYAGWLDIAEIEFKSHN